MQKIKPADALNIVRHLKEMLKKEGIPVRQAFLFGSYASGKTHDWSDIDVAVVHDPFLDTLGKEKSFLFKQGKSFDIRIELIAFQPADFENKYSSLAEEVKLHEIAVV
jgi:predicted nucleotidyltransferase